MIVLELEDRPQNKRRAYVIDVQPTLFGRWAVICQWGRTGSPHGHIRTYGFPSKNQAVSKAGEILQLRRKHGYVVVGKGALYETCQKQLRGPANKQEEEQ